MPERGIICDNMLFTFAIKLNLDKCCCNVRG